MKVSELIEMLQDCNPDQEVVFAHPAHDYWKTTLATAVDRVELDFVKESSYHQQDVLCDYDDEERENEAREVVVLS